MPNRFFVLLFSFTTILNACRMESADPFVRSTEKIWYTKDSILKFSQESPFSTQEKTYFVSLEHFPASAEYRVKAKLELFDKPQFFLMPNSRGLTEEYYKMGIVIFRLGGRLNKLGIYQMAKYLNDSQYRHNLFLPFADATNGKETYEGGRFLDIEDNGTGEIVIDFNLAYNPYCAYSHEYTCPVPPSENNLPFRVEAGELKYSH